MDSRDAYCSWVTINVASATLIVHVNNKRCSRNAYCSHGQTISDVTELCRNIRSVVGLEVDCLANVADYCIRIAWRFMNIDKLSIRHDGGLRRVQVGYLVV